MRSLALQIGRWRGETALHIACRRKNLELAKLLAEKMSREAALGLNEVKGSDVLCRSGSMV